MKRKLQIITLLGLIITCSTFCSKNNSDAVPFTSVDLYVYLNNPSSNSLNAVGGYLYLTGGVRGIVLFRKSIDEFVALERNCTYQPTNVCATVRMDKSGTTLTDTCCGSQFQVYNGAAIKPPATQPLRLYNTSLSNGVVHITTY